jgi:hypothetical protein
VRTALIEEDRCDHRESADKSRGRGARDAGGVGYAGSGGTDSRRDNTPNQTCNSGTSVYTYLQTTSASNSYLVPSRGVLTSWSHSAAADPVEQIKLKVARAAGGDSYTTIGEGADYEVPLANTLNSYPVRLPVEAGDLIGFAFTGIGSCIEAPVTGYGARFVQADPTVSTMSLFGSEGMLRLAVTASLEPDADADGFGDETQDECPTDPSTQRPCRPETDPPKTSITKGAPNKLDKTKVKFKFTSSEPDSTFECKLDQKEFKPCASPKKVKRLDDGKHKFKVRAIDAAGNVDPSPAKDKFKVVD